MFPSIPSNNANLGRKVVGKFETQVCFLRISLRNRCLRSIAANCDQTKLSALDRMLCKHSAGKGRTQDMFVRAAACAATSEFAVNHDRRHAADTVLLRLGSSLGLMHVVDD